MLQGLGPFVVCWIDRLFLADMAVEFDVAFDQVTALAPQDFEMLGLAARRADRLEAGACHGLPGHLGIRIVVVGAVLVFRFVLDRYGGGAPSGNPRDFEFGRFHLAFGGDLRSDFQGEGLRAFRAEIGQNFCPTRCLDDEAVEEYVGNAAFDLDVLVV